MICAIDWSYSRRKTQGEVLMLMLLSLKHSMFERLLADGLVYEVGLCQPLRKIVFFESRISEIYSGEIIGVEHDN